MKKYKINSTKKIFRFWLVATGTMLFGLLLGAPYQDSKGLVIGAIVMLAIPTVYALLLFISYGMVVGDELVIRGAAFFKTKVKISSIKGVEKNRPFNFSDEWSIVFRYPSHKGDERTIGGFDLTDDMRDLLTVILKANPHITVETDVSDFLYRAKH
jgi:hypothetical protein